MKKMITVTLLIMICFTATISLSGCSDSMKIIFRGRDIVGDTLPIVQEDEVFYPLVDFCDAINVNYYQHTQYENKITIRKGTEVEIFINKDIISIDDVRGELKNRPIIQDDVVFIPIGEVATALGYEVEQKSNKLIITEVLNLVVKETNKNETTYYEYDESGNLLKEYSEDYFRTYEYDENGNLLFVYNDDGEISESYKYDEKGRKIERYYTYVGGHTTDKFDNRGNLIYREEFDDKKGLEFIIEWEYDADYNLISQSVTHANSDVDSYITTCTYDSEGKCLSEKRTGTGAYSANIEYAKNIIIKEYVYADGRKDTSIYDYNEKALLNSMETYNAIESINYNENSVEIVTNRGSYRFVFNQLNLLILSEFNGDTLYKYSYDKYGNLLNMEDKYGNVMEENIYNDISKMVVHNLNGRLYAKYKYDDKGNVIYIEDYYGNTAIYEYDENGYLIYKEVKQEEGESNISEIASYRYGATICEYKTIKRWYKFFSSTWR